MGREFDIVVAHAQTILFGIRERHTIAVLCKSFQEVLNLSTTLVKFYEAEGGERQHGSSCCRFPAAVPGQLLSSISCPNCVTNEVEKHISQGSDWNEELHCCHCCHDFMVSVNGDDVIVFSTWHSHDTPPTAAKAPWPNVEN